MSTGLGLITLLKSTIEDLLDVAAHTSQCMTTRVSGADCTCGLDDVKHRAYMVLGEEA